MAMFSGQRGSTILIFSHLFFFILGLCMNNILIAFRQEAIATTLSSSYAVMPAATSHQSLSQERDFYKIAEKMKTDKVAANYRLPGCLNNPDSCTRKGCVRKECRPWGHFYNTMYQKRLGQYSTDNTEPFQFLEIGFYNGFGYDTYKEFMPKAEAHSMEISCIEEGPRAEGKWPKEWGNFALKNKRYQEYRDTKRLHCGDASDVNFLHKIWTTEMNRTDAPPLKIVVDDGAHVAAHMAQSVFFWFPRIQPRGLMVVEDIQPIKEANKFRTQFLPQIMTDLHYCGDPAQPPDTVCFPTLQPLLASIHCEMHICIFERNDEPAVELSLENSTMPKGALDLKTCQAVSDSF
jgi:Methyltransferase domain